MIPSSVVDQQTQNEVTAARVRPTMGTAAACAWCGAPLLGESCVRVSKPPAAYDQWYACPTCPTSGLLLCFASFFLLRSEPSHDAHPRLPLFKTCMPYGHADGSGGDVAVPAATAATAAAWVTAVMVVVVR